MIRRELLTIFVLSALCAAMCLIPSPRTVAADCEPSVRARVVSTDDSTLTLAGLLEYGSQILEVELLDGPEKGRRVKASNEMRAQPDIDKRFEVGETILINWPKGGVKDGESIIARDHWRRGWIYVMFGGFAALLILFGGWTGAKALFSFVFSCFAVWKLLVPLCLAGWSASWTSFAVVSVLTAVIMYLVAGLTRKGVAAFLGAMLGVGVSLVLAHFFSSVMKVTGATQPYVIALINAGYPLLDMADIFVGAVILASSGAVMDLAMDIAAGADEVKRHNPSISRRDLFNSSIRIGRAVVGTMTTTLLLAYSGGYITLLMLFAAQGTSPYDFINSTLVSAELVKTLVGSFGLVMVSPFTALAAAWIYSRKS